MHESTFVALLFLTFLLHLWNNPELSEAPVSSTYKSGRERRRCVLEIIYSLAQNNDRPAKVNKSFIASSLMYDNRTITGPMLKWYAYKVPLKKALRNIKPAPT